MVITKWEREGRPVPSPHEVKQMFIEEYTKKYHCTILVETGTCQGRTVEDQRRNFKRIYSIELGMDLWKYCIKRFTGFKHITILQGDSGQKLNEIVPQLDEKALFWLDGHYSAGHTARGESDCPILAEIDAIFKGTKLNHVLLVDDARCFTNEGEFRDYPTINYLTKYIQAKDPRYTVKVQDDIIRYTCE